MLYNKDWDKKVSPVADTLNRCADHLEKYGWCQFEVGKYKAPMCTIGVLSELSELGDDYMSAKKALAKYIGISLTPSWSIVDWNNTKGRTKEEVIAKFRGAANSV